MHSSSLFSQVKDTGFIIIIIVANYYLNSQLKHF